MRSLCLIPFLFSVACSGGAGALDETPGTPDGDGGITVPDTIPVTGRASYQGQLGLNLPNATTTATSALALAVDFGAATTQVTGEARAFAGYEGAIFMTLGTVDADPAPGTPTIAGRLSGTLKQGARSHLIFGTYAAEFSGAGQVAMRGSVTGSAITSGIQASVTGSFQAGRLP